MSIWTFRVECPTKVKLNPQINAFVSIQSTTRIDAKITKFDDYLC